MLNLLKLADVAGNVVLLGSPRVETFSRRAGLARDKGKPWGCVVCKVLNAVVKALFGDPDHCTSAVEAGMIE